MTASLIRQNEVDIGANPVQHEYTGWWDIAKANFESQVKNYNFSSAYDNRYDTYKENYNKYIAASGEPNAAQQHNRAVPLAETYKKFDSVILQKRNEGDTAYDSIKTSEEIDELLMQQARDAEANASTVEAQADPDTWKWTAKLAGGAAGWVTDPVQSAGALLTAVPAMIYGVGATAGLTIARTAGLEAVGEMGLETISQTNVIDWQEKLGNEYGWDEAGVQIAMAGILSGAFTVGGFGVAKLAGKEIPVNIPKDSVFDAHMEVLRQTIAEPSRVTDSDILEAHYRSVDAQAEAFKSLDAPRIVVDRRVSNKIFNDDLVTHDHLRVVTSAPDTVPLEVHAKDVFVREMITEFRAEQGLARSKNLESLVKKVEADSVLLKSVKSNLDKARLELKALSNLPADTTMAERISSAEAKVSVLEKQHKRLRKSVASGTKSLRSTSTAKRADEYLEQLEIGNVPVGLQKRFDSYMKSVKKAKREYKQLQKEAEEYAANVLSEFAGPPTERLMNAMNNFVGPIYRGTEHDIRPIKEIKESAPEIQAVTDRQFQVEAKKSVTGESTDKFQSADLDGNDIEMTASELDEMFKEEDDMLRVLKSCFMGGAK
jgi:hypothetical protein